MIRLYTLSVYNRDGTRNLLLSGRKFKPGLEIEFAVSYMAAPQKRFEVWVYPLYQLKTYMDTVPYTE